MNLSRILLFLLFVGFAPTCGAFGGDKSPVGVWQIIPGTGIAIEFRTNGVVEGNIWNPDYGRMFRLKGSWSSTTNGTLALNFRGPYAPAAAKIDPQTEKLKLTWTTSYGSTERTLRRTPKLPDLKAPNLRESPSVRSNIYPVSKRSPNARIEDDEIRVTVFGHVQFPGLYYCPDTTEVFDLVRLCRPGASAAQSSPHIQRRKGSRLVTFQIKDSQPKKQFELKDGDVVHVPYIPFDDRFFSNSEE